MLMNPFALFRALRTLPLIIQQANKLARGEGEVPRWSNAYTNRSFWLMVIAFAIQIAEAFGYSLPFTAEMASEHIVNVITAVLVLWAFLERLLGKTRALWTTRQAKKALQEAIAVDAAPQAAVQADKLTEALKKAGAPVAK